MAEKSVSRRLVAVLAADVAGYTRLMEQDSDGTVAAWQAARDSVIDPAISEHGGRIVKLTGDGFLAEFPVVQDAVKCAVNMQKKLGTSSLDFRMGVNLGDIIDDGEDIHGEGVNIAARLEGLAEPGGICISAMVHDSIRNRITARYVDLGEQQVKNVSAPVRVYAIHLGGSADTPARVRALSPLEFAPPEKPSIAILPFKSLGADPDQGYIADGIRLGVQATLVQLSGLFLVNVPALNAYREKEDSAISIGAELDVRYMLDGAVQQAGKHIRATINLTDVITRKAIWAERYDRTLDDVFELQDEITREVISSLNVKLITGEASRVWFDKLSSPEAREFFYRGSSYLYGGNKQDNEAARHMFEELYRVQPNAVQGPSNIAVTHWIDAFVGWTDPSARSIEQAATWAEKAIQYEDNNGLGHTILGHIQLLEGRYDEAVASCSKGVKLRASCPLAHGLLGVVQNYSGDARAAVKSIRDALQLEKVYPPWLIDVLAAAYRDSGEVDLSISVAKESIRLNPQNNGARLILCSDYKLATDNDQAQRVADEIIASEPTFRLSNFAKSQPYQNPAELDRLIATLRDAGLPD